MNTSPFMCIGLVSTFGPEVRGVSPYSDALLSALNGCGVETEKLEIGYMYPQVLSFDGGDEIRSPGVSVFNPLSWFRLDLKNLAVIHLQYWTFLTLPFYIYLCCKAKKLGCKVVVTVHNPKPHEALPLVAMLEAKLFRAATCFVVHTASGKALLEKRGLSDVTVIPHGVSVKAASEKEEYDKCVVFFGNIRRYKGLSTLLAAWRGIGKARSGWNLQVLGRFWRAKTFMQKITQVLLGGSRWQEPLLQDMASPPEGVKFELGFIEDERLDDVLGRASLAVFPYLQFESQSGAAARAAGMGVPIFVSDVGGLPELAISNDFVFEAGSKKSLELGLAKLLEDTRLLTGEFSKKQINKVSSCSWEVVATFHRDLYLKLVSST